MERLVFQDEISRNKRNSFLLVFVIFIVLIFLGFVISRAFSPGYFYTIMIISVIFSTCYLLATYNSSDKIALASVRAKPANQPEYRQYYNSVEGLTLASGLPMPKLYIMENPSINAFASGKNPEHAVICVTTGALEKLNKQELEGVLSHELSHVANYDIRFMTLAAVMVGMISIISQIFLRSLRFKGNNDRKNNINIIFMLIGVLLAILAPIFTTLVQLSISRKREFSADATAVKFTRYPPGLANALRKIKKDIPMTNTSKAMSSLFISEPKRMINIWSTHPPLEERIKRLEVM